MTAQETIELIRALKEAGVARFKQGNITIEFTNTAPVIEKPIIPLDAPVEETQEIKHEEHQLTSLLKLSDTDLVDRLWPEPVEEESA